MPERRASKPSLYKHGFRTSTTRRTSPSILLSVVACNVELLMVPSTSTAEPTSPYPGVPFTRSDSVASSVQSGGLRRRLRTRTRSIALSKRGKSQEPSAANSNSRSETGESFFDFDDAPPVPKVLCDEPEEMTVEQMRAVKRARRRSRTVGAESRPQHGGLRPEMPQMARARSALDVREPPFEQVRGRQAKSDNVSIKVVRHLSLCDSVLVSDTADEGKASCPQSYPSGSPTTLSFRRLIATQSTYTLRIW